MANPSTPLPGDKVDIELNAIKTTITQLLANLALIQRDDGEVASSSIGLEQMDGALISLGFDRPSNWAASVAYVVNSAVFKDNKLYICLVAHTSNIFATDLALGKWVETIDFTTLITDAQDAAADAQSFAADALGSASAAAASAAAAAAVVAAALPVAGGTMLGEITLTGSGSAALHAASLGQVQKGIQGHSTAVGGTVDAIDLTMAPASTTWTLNEEVHWKSGGTNTVTNPTISKGGGTAKTIKKGASAALAIGDLGASGYEPWGVYNGTDVILQNPASSANYTVSGQVEETVPAIGDFAGGYDLSATAERKFTLANIFKVINGLTEDATPDVDNDFFPSYDASASSAKKVKLRSMLKRMSSLTEDLSPDSAADFVLTYDTSAGDVKKVKPSNLVSSSGGFERLKLLDVVSGGTYVVDNVTITKAYKRIEIMLKGISHASGGSAGVPLTVELSGDNGSTYSTKVDIVLSFDGTSTTADAHIIIDGAELLTGDRLLTIWSLFNTSTHYNAVSTVAVTTGYINAFRLDSTSTFDDSGTATVIGWL